MDVDRLEFMFKGMPVGYFEESEYPRRGGRYRNMPYRGPGHYQMGLEMREKGSARCYFNVGPEQISFTVSDRPEYGLLELEDFEASGRG